MNIGLANLNEIINLKNMYNVFIVNLCSEKESRHNDKF